MSFPHRVVPVFGSGRAYADLNFAGGSFGLDGRIVNDTALLSGFTFTGASLRMGFDSTGKLTYGPNNLLLQSQTFDNASWAKTNSVVTADAAVAPDGTTTADKLVCNNGVSSGRVSQVVATLAGSRNLMSVYVKPAGWDWFALRVAEDAAPSVYFNVNAGTIGTVESGWSGATITSAGNGWYRISAYYTAVGASYTWRLIPTNGNTMFFTGDGTNGSYVWGAQLEAVTYRTTPAAYMPTTSAAYYGPRLVYDPVTLASLGILVELAATNVCLWNRDLTNAAWVPVNVTPVKDQTGIDGVANSASKITATAGNGTILQAITLASSARQQSTYIKRITGSGVIEMTTDNGTTWTAVTVTASWTRVPIPVQTLANPTVGFRIVTSGDAVAIDCVQNETSSGAGPSSPIVTTTASVTCASDVSDQLGLSIVTPFSVVVEFSVAQADTLNGRRIIQVTNPADTSIAQIFMPTGGANVRFAVPGGNNSTANSMTLGSTAKAAFRAESSLIRGCLNGGALVEYAGGPGTGLDRIHIGHNNVAPLINGTISRIRIYNRALSDAQLQALTA